MTRFALGLTLVLAAACRSAPEQRRATAAPVVAQAGSAAPPATMPATPRAAPDGRDLPAPLYAGMFIDGATFDYTVYAYKVDQLGERHATKDTPQRVRCVIRELVFMQESKSLSARLICDDEGPWNGVMFAARDGFWWYDEQRYLAGGFVMNADTKVFDREPKVTASMPDPDGRTYSVTRESDDRWCWSESFDHPWTSQGLCFADGHIVSGWAANNATAKTRGDYIEFRLAK